MILKQLSHGRLHSDLILIKDNLSISGLKLLKHFITVNVNQGNNVIFLMFENPNYEFNNEFSTNKNFTACNCFGDPWNWLGKGQEKFEEIVYSSTNASTNSLNVIIIDSLSYLLLHSDIYSLCNDFKTIFDSNTESRRNQIITVMHTLIGQDENVKLKQIDCFAKSVITLKNRKTNIVVIEHRKPSGKIMKEEYSCCLDGQGNFSFDTIKSVPKETPNVEINPMNLTTFKLSLEESEKESRSRVVLPYVKTEERPSRIFYEPDANDDWDDEDPDDDLEI